MLTYSPCMDMHYLLLLKFLKKNLWVMKVKMRAWKPYTSTVL